MAEQQNFLKKEEFWPEFLSKEENGHGEGHGFPTPPLAAPNAPSEEIDLLTPLPPPPDLDIGNLGFTTASYGTDPVNHQSLIETGGAKNIDTLTGFELHDNVFMGDSTQSFGVSLSQVSSGDANPVQDPVSYNLSLSQDNSQAESKSEDVSSPNRISLDIPSPPVASSASFNVPTHCPPPIAIPAFSTTPVLGANSSSITITSLDPLVTDQEIVEHIASVTNIEGIHRQSPTVCIVMFQSITDAFTAAAQLNGLEIRGVPIQVNLNESSLSSPAVPSSSSFQSKSTLVQTIDMSRQLHQYFETYARADIERLVRDGGLLTYNAGTLYIEGPSLDLIESFKTNIISKYTEKSVSLTESQWEELMADDGKKFIELVRPFETNSNVTILPLANEEKLLLIVGVAAAVESAHGYCWNNLAKEIRIERVKLDALKIFHPNLSNDIFIQYQVTLTFTSEGITLDGLSHTVPQARACIEDKLSQIRVTSLPPFKPILFLSFKRKLSSMDPKKAVILSDNGTERLCCRNEDDLQEVLKIHRKKKSKEVNVSGHEAMERLRSRHLKEIQCIEQDCLVDISLKTKASIIFIQGYVNANVNEAKEKVLALLKNAEVTRRVLEAPPSIGIYVHHCIFKQPNEATKKLLSGLSCKVTESEGAVYLEGPCDDVSEDEKKVSEHFSLSQLEHREFPFAADCRFISHIESDVLRPLHQKRTFTHVISRHDNSEDSTRQSSHSSRQGRRHSSSTEGSSKGFTISLYSTSTEDFNQVCSEMEVINPHTESVAVPQKSTDFILKKKPELEKAHPVRMFLVGSSTQSPKVLLHGIRDSDIQECRLKIEDTLFITKEIQVSGYQVVYLKTKCQAKLEELQGKCRTVLLPQSRIQGHQFPNMFSIKVIGKTSAANAVCEELKEFLCDFSVNKFTVTTTQSLFGLWKRRWLQVKKEMELEHEVMLEFFESGGGPREDKRGGGRGKAPGKPPTAVTGVKPSTPLNPQVPVTFTVYGLSKEAVEEVTKVIKSHENGESVRRELLIKDEFRIPHLGGLAQSLGIAESVWLQIEGKSLVVIGPSSAASEVDAAVEKIQSHLDSTSTMTETFQYNDEFISAIITRKAREILKEASETAKRENIRLGLNFTKKPVVTFTLTGHREGIEIVKKLVQGSIEETKERKSTRTLHVDYYKAPYFKTEEFKRFAAEMKEKQSVIITTSPLAIGSNTVIISKEIKPSPIGHSLQVSIVNGNLLKENVDAIVNAANKDLNHIGGLAYAILTAAGGAMQTECRQYIATNGPVQPGSAVCLGAGTLSHKHIIHAVSPIWQGGHLNEQVTLEHAILNTCLEAHNNSLTSIAIPALGTGVYHVPGSVCASASIAGLTRFCQTVQSSTLHSVRFVLLPNLVDDFVKALKAENRQTIAATSSVIQSPVTQQQQLIWSWRDNDNTFKQYDPQINHLLSQRYHRSPTIPCQITVRGTIYVIDFQAMMQTNTQTNFTRKVKLTQPSDEAEDEEEKGEEDPVQWYFFNDKQQWAPYDQQSSSQLESWYQNDSPTGRLVIGRHTYSFDFKAMQQTNISTGNARAMKRLCPLEVEEGSSDIIQWYFKNDKENFQKYNEEESQQLEEWYQNGTNGRLRIGKFIYSFDFNDMTQCNTRTNTTRAIKRQGPEVVEVAEKAKVPVTLCGPQECIDRVVVRLQAKLDGCLQNDTLKIKSPTSSLEATLRKIAHKHSIKLELIRTTTDGGKSAQLYGLKELVKEALTEMQKCLLAQMEEAASSGMITVQKPKEWQPQKNTVEIFVVQEGTKEYQHVISQFTRTMPNATVCCIERIQNQYLWEKYSNHRALLHKKNSGQVNEKELFHGTRNNDPKQIYDSEEGFDMRFSASGMWGQANYFAVNASYSDSYAHQGICSKVQRQTKQMFLAKVLTGITYECASDSKLRMPPEKPSFVPATRASYVPATGASNIQLSQVRYDTVSGKTNGSDVFMTYDNLKAYPAYLISYESRRSYYPF